MKTEASHRFVVGETVEYSSMRFESRIIEASELGSDIPKKQYTKWFDYDKISGEMCLRHRSAGDYIVVDAEGHRKKLKRYFTDEKIPRDERDLIVCLADENKIIWVVGGRISEDCKISGDTKRVLEIRVTNGDFRNA